MSAPDRKTLQELYLARAVRLPQGASAAPNYPTFGVEPAMEEDRGVRTLDPTPLQRAFFSAANVRIIQNALRFEVWQRSMHRHVIAPQNEQDLRIVMRAIFTHYARHAPRDIAGQVAELNARVVAAVVPKVLGQVDSYLRFLEDAARPLQVQEHPLNVSTAGTKSLEWGREAASPFGAAP